MTDNIPPPLAQMTPPQITPPSQTPPPQQAPSRSSWPTAIGVISIVLGSLGLICTPLSALVSRFSPQIEQVQGNSPDWYMTYSTASLPVGIALAVLLLVAGICLLKRIHASRALHLTYAGANIAWAVIGSIMVITVLFPSFLEGDMPNKAAVIGGMVGGAIVGMAFGMVWPIFLLVWFRRRKIRQQVQGW